MHMLRSARKPERWYFEAPEATAALRQRHQFVEYLQTYGGDMDAYGDAEFLFGELVGNVLVHAPGAIEVLVDWPDGRAMLYVTDEGLPIPPHATPPADPLSEHGRGLMIVERLASKVTSNLYPGFGKMIGAALTVWCRRKSMSRRVETSNVA